MDDTAHFAAARGMMKSFAYACLFMVTLVLQTGAVASLPAPYRLFPLLLVVGVIILHERSLVLGTAWLALAGIVLEARGLGDGLAVAGLVSAGVAAGLAVSVFAKRSFWALLGVGGGTAVAYVAARLVWLALWAALTQTSRDFGTLIGQGGVVILLALLGVFLFGAYIRRFLRWGRNKFVSKGQLYDISSS